MARNRYTYKAAWSAEASRGDFKKLNLLRAAIKRSTGTEPTERAIVSVIVQHLFDTASVKDLNDLYKDAHAIAVKEQKAKDEAERKKKEAERIKELKAELRKLEGK